MTFSAGLWATDIPGMDCLGTNLLLLFSPLLFKVNAHFHRNVSINLYFYTGCSKEKSSFCIDLPAKRNIINLFFIESFGVQRRLKQQRTLTLSLLGAACQDWTWPRSWLILAWSTQFSRRQISLVSHSISFES